MAFLKKIFGEQEKKRVFVLGLDGVPYSFLKESFAYGRLPNLKALAEGGSFSPLTSVYPTVSSVAWTSYMTGKNPGKHGIYGFVDRQAGSYDVSVPTSLNVRGRTLWEIVGDAGHRVVVINVPETYPPRPVNGVLVSCFLCTNMDRVAYPVEVSTLLKSLNYRIDANSKLARTSTAAFTADVYETLDRRFDAARELMRRYPWDFFQLHVMETDRINHFLTPVGPDDPLRHDYLAFYERVDAKVGELVKSIPPEVCLVLLSDHGFCPLKKEVHLNQYLVEQGLLQVPPGGTLVQLLPETLAYSLIPGRIYLNIEGREPRGSVRPSDYRRVLDQVTKSVMALRDPDGGAQVIKEVIPGEKLFHGEDWSPFPMLTMPGVQFFPPDLVAIPENGYDLKGTITPGGVFGRSELKGMHTQDDAFLLVRDGAGGFDRIPNLVDLLPSVLDVMGVRKPDDLDGRSLGF